jgi:hypothetical protein
MANWTTQFGSPADCECEDCNSVFSPAAYLVDIMQYLDHCKSNGPVSQSVLQVLFERRPDIGNLLLTCENTNTEIPYIDLVNEIMEYYVLYCNGNKSNGNNIISNAHAGTSDSNISALIVAAGTPVVTGAVTYGSAVVSLTVNSSTITSVNFTAGDIIIISGIAYNIASVPTGLNTAIITFNLDTNYTGSTNAALAATAIQIYQPPGDTGKVTADELTAEPQNILIDAYSTIYSNAVYPFNLPYHQPLDVIRSYLSFLKTSRAELMEIFPNNIATDNTTSPATITVNPIPPAAVDAENMQLTLMEYEILTNADFFGNNKSPKPNVEDYFGDPSPVYTGHGIPVTNLLQRIGLQYTDLVAILETQFINPGQNALNVLQNMLAKATGIMPGDLYKSLNTDFHNLSGNINNALSATTIQLLTNNGVISQNDQTNFKNWLINNFTSFQQTITLYESTSACDIDNTFLHSVQCVYETPPSDTALSPAPDTNITANFLSRLHRFIRLWHKTGWTIHELDSIISALDETDITPMLNITPMLIHKLTIVNKVNVILQLPLLQLACLWGNIDTYGDNSLNVPGKSLYAQLFLKNTGNVTTKGTQTQSVFAPNPLNEVLNLMPIPQLADHLPELFAALAISAVDYDAILSNANLADDNISLVNLSILYRYALLANTLNISVVDLCTIENLFNPAFGAMIFSITANIAGAIRSTLIVDTGAPAVTGQVTTGSSQISLSVATTSKIINVNFNIGDIILLNGIEYFITSLPTGINSSIITFNIERNYSGASNSTLPASSIQIYQPSTLDFIQKVQNIQNSDFSVADLNYILSGTFKDIDNIALTQDQILQALPGLRSALSKIDTDNPMSDASIITIALLTQKLMLLYSTDIADQFVLMLESSVPPTLSVVVPDQSYTIADPVKYSYNITLVYASPNGTFQVGETITDSNGSTAIAIANISDTKLTLTDVTLISPNNALAGSITGKTSNATATVVSYTILFQLIGVMTDDEYSKISSSAGLTAGFKTAVDNLYQQSLAALNQELILTAPQTICLISELPNLIFSIPTTLSPKYSYFQNGTSWLLQCKGIMSDNEYSQLKSQGNVQFQSAVNYIYIYPSTFLQNNFTGLYNNSKLYNSSNINAPLQNLFGLSGVAINSLPGKLQYFYKAFLPFLITQLKQQQSVSAISSLINLDVQSVIAVINSDVSTLIAAASEPGLNAYYSNNPLLATDPIIKTDGGINFSWGNTSPVTSANFSVQWKGWLCPATDGDYIFTIITTDPSDQANLLVNGLKADTNTIVSLVGGQLYTIELDYTHTSGNSGIQLFWQSATMSQSIIDTQFLYPGTDVQTLLQKALLYHRASQFINGFALTVAEVEYFINNLSDFSKINFLPINNIQWLRTYNYTILRKIIPTNLLLSIFHSASVESNANTGSLPSDNLISTIAGANKPGWDKGYLSYLVSYFKYTANDFKNEIAFLQIKKAMDLAIKTKMPINQSGLPSWTSYENDPATSIDLLHPIAEQIKNAVKGKYSDNWLTIATQLNNPIRENQKQALISYLLTLQLPAPDGMGSDGSGKITDADGLFEYLLIDVQITSAVVTSRLIRATLAVQLFADRCLLGLEREVPLTANAIDPDEWDWMKHYSVYAGLKKLFVYVENYLDPSLRDDKSPFFLDFESAIKKGDITDENVENAFRDYLYKLNEVSNMEQRGMYYDSDTQTIYVFARTHAAPYNYYFRTASTSSLNADAWTWAPWEQVQLDIKSIDAGNASGVHLMPVLWKKRLFLFWPEFMEQTNNPTNLDKLQTYQGLSNTNLNDPSNIPQKYWEIRLAWSEYTNNKWTPKKLSKETISLNTNDVDYNDASPNEYFFQSSILNEILTLDLYGYLAAGYDSFIMSFSSFVIKDIHEKFVISTSNAYGSPQFNPYRYQSFESAAFYSSPLVIDKATFLPNNSSYELLFSNNVSISDFESNIKYPFFYTDANNNRTYFVTPTGNFGRLFRKGPIFGGLTNQINAHLSLYNANGTTASIQPKIKKLTEVPQVADKKIDKDSALQKTTKATAENIIVEGFTNTSFQTQAHPLINNFDNSIANQSAIGQIIAKGTQRYRPNITNELPPFAGRQIIAIEVPVLAFYTFYHPFASLLTKRLNLGGVPLLLAANTAEFMEDSNYPNINPYNSVPVIDNGPAIPANDKGTTFSDAVTGYNPNFSVVQQYNPPSPNQYSNHNYYLENVDFSLYGTYSSYNWELFFHAPFLIATSLSKNGKYAEARKWFHYIFNPTSTEKADPNNANSPFWKVLPFKYSLQDIISTELENLSASTMSQASQDDFNAEVTSWQNNPFNAFLIARARPIAFMKNVVMSYLDNLIAWGDDLFRTYIRENINEATQLYIIAAKILGPTPQYIPSRGIIQSASYNQLKSNLDEFGDAIVQLENAFPNSSKIQQTDNSVPQNLLGIGQALYFCVPPNDKLLAYWTTVGDRLFKIRHGENINGLVVPLALYQPPIDPALLLQAKAQGLDIAGILADLDSPAPLYRFIYLLQKAKEFCNEVVSLGNAVLSANEKQDAEQLSRLRQTQEIAMLNLVTAIKTRQVLEAQANLDNLSSSRATALQRLQHYVVELLGNGQPTVPDAPILPNDLDENSNLPGETIINQVTSSIDVTLASTDESGVKIIPKEKQEMDFSAQSTDALLNANAAEMLAGILRLIPQFKANLSPLGVGVGDSFGGIQLGAIAEFAAKAFQSTSSLNSFYASTASKMASFIRREQEWVFQANMTAREIIQLDKQIIAAQIRLQIAQHELDNNNTQIQNAQDIETFLETKFSNQELYDWMLDKLQGVHKQGYQLAYDMARIAEKAYRFELGLQESSFVQYGYYNDTYLGITAGEQLQMALNQMDSAYIANNVREFELVKHISIVQLDPLALIQLRETGSCQVTVPEQLFDIDYPGHYFRRIKSVSISIPCVAGPYTTVNSTLRLQNNSLRIDTIINGANPQASYIENNIPFTAIATSSAQNDSGMFELNFRDERYLPFEGAGAISTWQLELNGKYLNSDDGTITDFSQFDYDTITDIIIHLKYTSREDDGDFRKQQILNLQAYKQGQNFTRLFSIRHEFPNEFYAFLNQPDAAGNQILALDLMASRFPYFASLGTISISKLEIFADMNIEGSNDFSFSVNSNTNTAIIDCTTDNNYGSLLHGTIQNYSAQISSSMDLKMTIENKAGNTQLTNQNLKDLFLAIHYAIL